MEQIDYQLEDIWARERAFHDSLADRLDVDGLEDGWPTEGFEGALARLAGDVTDARVLDVGCGQGDLTLHLLQAGAHVTALDLSPRMVELVRRRAERLDGVSDRLACIASPLERSGLPDGAFDLIVGRWVLHHLDPAATGRELKRLLRSGGRAVFIETSGENPLLALARRRLAGRFGIPRYGTEDEHPLVQADLDVLGQAFERVHSHYPEFVFFSVFDRQVLRYRWRPVSRLMTGLDRLVWRTLPGVRRFSYYVIVELRS